MKIRFDFVSNSSSSSFIIGAKNLEEEFKNIDPEAVFYMKSNMSEVFSRDEILEKYKDMIEYDCLYMAAEDRFVNRWSSEAYNWMNSEEGIKASEKKKNSMIKKFIKKISDKEEFAIVEAYDHDTYGAIMEFDIMPSLKITLHSQNNH